MANSQTGNGKEVHAADERASGPGGGGATAEASEVKRKLAWRMGFAGLMIVMLLGTLAVFDYLSAPDEPAATAPRFSEPVPVPKKDITQPLKAPEPAPEGNKAAEPEVSAAPVDKSAPPLEAPSRPEVAAQPVLPRAQPISPSTVEAPPEARATPATRPAPSVQPAAPSAPLRPEARGSEAAARPGTEEPAAAVRLPPAPPRLFSGFALQAGVFSDLHRAEELHAKLTLNGIPSTLEARVQVGPFKTRAEADAAREKMKALGIDSVMLTPKGATRR